MTIHLLRHGESQGNRAKVFSGISDHPLTALGRQQAQEAGERFRGWRFSALFTSCLSRTIETADIFLAASGARVDRREAREELNERDFGTFEAQYQPPIESLTPDDIRWRICRDVDFAPPGGELMRQTHARAISFLEQARGDASRGDIMGDIMIVGHGNVLRSMTLYALGWPIEMLPEMPSRNCLVTRLS